jgi:hypothetical protein
VGATMNVVSNDRVLKLIELYHGNQCLWDGQRVDYKNRNKKTDAWNNIAEEMGTPRNIIEAKMHSIRSQFMRERNNVQNSKKSGAGADEVYVPARFAYQHLLFLLNNVDPGDSSDTLSQHSQSAGEINKVNITPQKPTHH